jgi:hypothetical protein
MGIVKWEQKSSSVYRWMEEEGNWTAASFSWTVGPQHKKRHKEQGHDFVLLGVYYELG